jgi:copper transport protein
VTRFSALALFLVAVIVASGAYLAWVHVGGLAPLGGTLYGLSLGAKLALVVPLVAVAALSFRLNRAGLARPDGGAAAARFGRNVRREALLGGAVLLAAAWLASLPPARGTWEAGAARRPLALEAPAGDLAVALAVAQPAASGGLTVTLRDRAGRPVDDAERVDLRLTYLDDELGTRAVRAEPAQGGRYTVGGPYLTLDGRWQAEVVVRRPGRDDGRTAFRFAVADGLARPAPGAAEALLPLPELRLAPILGWLLLALVALLVADAARRGRLASRDGAVLLVGSLAVVALGLWLGTRPGAPSIPGGGGATPSSRRNPFAPDAASLAAGRAVYEARCAACHGPRGAGDGPAATGLNPPPADFRIHMAAGHTDAQLFGWLSDGVPGTAMPAFAAQLGEAERWHVINYIRGFAAN